MNFSRIAASLCLVALTACSSSPAPKACQSGQVSQYNGTAWECVALQQLLPSTCEVGQVITFTGSGIACTTPGTAVGPTGTTGAAGATGATGPTGSQGTTGLQGVPALNWQGTWEASTSYMTGDAVAFGGSSYIATSSNTADQPPSSSWDLLASEGTTGATGPNGLTGTAGMTGGIGLTGATGPVGANGAESLVVQTPEPPAGSCSAGGVQVQSGVDTNGDGILEPDEVTSTTELCKGPTGATGANGLNSLVSTSAIPSGSTCSNGGTLVQSGLDLNGDGSLEANEVTSTAPVCNGIPGAVSLVSMSPIASGTTCASGGTLVQSGVDANGDGILEPSEVTSTSNVCNGAAGAAGPVGPAGAAGVAGAVGPTGPQGIPGLGNLANLGLAAAVEAGGNLLVSLKQSDGATDPTAASPAVIGFRDTTPAPGTLQMIDVAGPLSLTAPEGATLGESSNVAAHLYVYAQNDAGAVQLCLSFSGSFDEGSLQTSVAMSTGASSTTVLYCTTAATGPVRLVGRLLTLEASAGTWVTNPSEVSIPPFQQAVSYGSQGTMTAVTSNGTFTTPANSSVLTVYEYQIVGGGGGGGSGAPGGSSSGGGGAGGYAQGTMTGLPPSTSIAISIGIAGTGSASGTGSTGGSSSIGAPVNVTTSGGAGSMSAESGAAAGGAGGTVTSGSPTLSITGMTGERGTGGFFLSGTGGSSLFGGGGPGSISGAGTGESATGYGAGGGGGSEQVTGGNGTPGVVVITQLTP